MTPQQLAEEYANSIVPNPDKHDAPYYTTRDKHEDLQEAFIKGYEANQSKWISIEDALPPVMEYIVCFNGEVHSRLFSRGYEQLSNDDFIKRTGVTHWQELPPKP